MKKTIALALFVSASFLACKNQPEQQEQSEITKTPETSTEVKSEKDAHAHPHADPHSDPHADPHANSHVHSQLHSHEYLYKSDNGEIFDVNFFEENLKLQVKIKRKNQEELVLDQTTAWSKGAEYENGNYKWTSRNNEGTFSDGKKTMNLVVISPLQYTFTNNKEDLSVTYFIKFDKQFVNIQKTNNKNVTLEQTSAWAKGAEYGKGDLKWRGDGKEGVLIENGIETTYNQKD